MNNNKEKKTKKKPNAVKEVTNNVTVNERDDDLDKSPYVLNELNEHIKDMKKHIIPQPLGRKEKNKRIVLNFSKGVLKGGVGLLAIIGSWDLCVWWHNKNKMEDIATRYANVGKEIYYKENNAKIASQFIDKAIEINFNNPEYHFQKAYIAGMGAVRNLLNLDRPMTRSELNTAHAALAEALFLKKMSPKRAEAYILEAQVLTALKEYQKAEELLKEAIAINPKNSFSYVRLGTLFLNKNQIDEALHNIKCALDINPKSKWANFWYGIAWAKKGLFVKARRYYNIALAQDPKFDLAWYNQGWTYIEGRNKNYKQAKNNFDKALACNPSYKEANYAMGMIYGYQNKYQLAKVYLDRAIKLDANFLTAYKWRGIINGEMKNNQEAIQDFNSAIELDPQNSDLRVRRANILCKVGKLNDAVVDLTFALELAPDNPRTYLYLGDVFSQAGNNDKALTYYKKALELSPNYAEAIANMAKLHFRDKKYNTAVKLLVKAEQVAEYKPERFALLTGDIFLEQQKCKEALKCYKRARTLDPKMASAWFGESKSLLMLNKKDAALSAINNYLNLHPQDSKAVLLKQKCLKKK